MKKLLMAILMLGISEMFAQEKAKEPTIPLNKSIQIKITSMDTSTFGRYIVYYFKFKKTKASFWAAKDDKVFKLGSANVELCRIIQLRDRKNGEENNMRGEGFINGLTIMAEDSVIKSFTFSEYSQSPTLRLCSTDK